MWKKLLTPTLILTLVILFAVTWHVSIRAEEHFALWVERANQVAPAISSTELISYNRQFFSAEAVTAIDLREIGRYEFHHLIRHYAWGASLVTTPLPTSKTSASLEGLRIVTDIGPTGAARSRLSMPQLTVESDLGPTVTIDRIAFEGRINAAASEGSWDLTLDQLRIFVDESRRVLMTGVRSSGDMTNLDYFPLGQNHTRFATIAVEDSGGKPFFLEGVEFHSKNLIDTTEKYLARSDLAFAHLQLHDHGFQNGRLVLELRDIDARALDVFVDALNNLREQTNAAPISSDDINSLVVAPLSEALLRSGLTLSLDELSLASADANLRAAGQATLLPGTAEIGLEQLPEQIKMSLQADFDLQILARIKGLFSGKGPSLAVKEEELRMVFGGLTQLGFISLVEEDRFRLLVSFEEGEFKLNGQAFRLF